MKEYKTNITAGFCFQWTKSKACMEFVSNALDQGDFEFALEGGTLSCTNYNVRLNPQVFMLGLSDKRDDDSKRGQFGCGIPQALAALLSQGCTVEMANHDVIWTPKFKHCDQWQEDVLVIEERHSECQSSIGSFTVSVSGLDDQDIDEIKQRCLVFQDRKVLHSTKYGDIICNEDGEGEVYCGDMYVCQNEGFKLSYNFLPKVVPLTQDRNAVNNWELKKLTAKMIIATEDVDFIKQCMKANNEDTSLVNYWSADHTPSEVDDSLAEEFLSEHGTSLITDDYDEHKENEALGNKSVYVNNEAIVKSVKASSVYKDAISQVEIVEKKTPHDIVYEMVDDLIDFIYCRDIIPSELHATPMEKEHEHYYLIEKLEQLREESAKWRN